MKEIKHIVCYSGGHSSALVAIETTRLFGKENVILLNHNINPRFEDQDIKRFKKEVADYLEIQITYANYNGITDENLIPNQFEVCEIAGSYVNPNNRQILCTSLLKTQPFYEFLKAIDKQFICVYYGFDSNELNRVERRKTILNDMGINSDFPLALWGDGKFENLVKFLGKKGDLIAKIEGFENKNEIKRTIFSTKEIGIDPPNTYNTYKHANCKGCLKAGKQHWYVVYCTDPEIYKMGEDSEEKMGHSFGKEFLKDIRPTFEAMKKAGIPANEHIPSNKFWKSAKKYMNQDQQDLFPCECFI